MFATRQLVKCTLVFLISIACIILLDMDSEAATLIVDKNGNGDHTTIQEAINEASPGDIIQVYDGTFFENLTINKPIIVQGNGSAATTIDLTGKLVNAINIDSDRITLQDLKIINTNKDRHNIWIENRNNITIRNLVIAGSGGSGIWFQGTDGSAVENCSIHDLEDGYGLVIQYGGNSSLDGINFSNNDLDLSVGTMVNTVVSNCDFMNRVSLQYSDGIHFSDCTFNDGSGHVGLHLTNLENSSVMNITFDQVGIVYKGDSRYHFGNDIVDSTIGDRPIIFYRDTVGTVIDGEDAGEIIAVNARDIMIKNLDLSDVHGITLAFCHGWTIKDSTFNRISGITSIGSTNGTITNCRIENASADGINFRDESQSVVDGSIISHCSQNAISFLGATECSIIETEVNDNKHGIDLWESHDCSIILTTVDGVQDNSGIKLDSSTGNLINRCTITNFAESGIQLTDMSHHNRIHKCLVSHEFIGIGITIRKNSHNNIVSSSTIEKSDAGIMVHESDNTLIRDCHITEAGIDDFSGITLSKARNTIVYQSYISNNKASGITIEEQCENSMIVGCTFEDNGYSKYVGDAGIVLEWLARDILISNCHFSHNRHGIRMESADNNIVKNCDIEDGEVGINLTKYFSRDFKSHNNTIMLCHIMDNGEGITADGNTENNHIHHNNIIDNMVSARDNGHNTWYSQEAAVGNHWSDYDEPGEGANDEDSNGIVDDPYQLPGGNSQDEYPLTFYPTLSPPIAEAGQNSTIEVGSQLTFDARDSISDKDVVNWTWRILNPEVEDVIYGDVVSHTFKKLGTYLVILVVTDSDGLMGLDMKWITVVESITGDIVPPVAKAGQDQVVALNDTFTLDGSGSTDNIGIVNWTWSWSFQGTQVRHYEPILHLTAAILTHIEFTLTVRDEAGNSHTDYLWVIITESGEDTIPPVAVADPDKVVEAGTTVTFDGIGSGDETLLVDWIWTFTHNGTHQELHGYGSTFTFWEVGTHVINLTVVDAAGNTDTDYMNVTVTQKEQNGSTETEDDDDDGEGFGFLIILLILVLIVIIVIMLKKEEIIGMLGNDDEGQKEQDEGGSDPDTENDEEPSNENDAPENDVKQDAEDPDEGKESEK